MNELKPEDVRDGCRMCYKHLDCECANKPSPDEYDALLREKDALIAKHEAYIDTLNDDKANLVEQIEKKDAEIKELTDDNKWSAKRIIETDKLVSLLKAEVERLNKEVDRLSQVVLYHDAFASDAIADARAEAITEFAERLKRFYSNLNGKTVGGSVEYHIDQIAKEMKGEQK